MQTIQESGWQKIHSDLNDYEKYIAFFEKRKKGKGHFIRIKERDEWSSYFLEVASAISKRSKCSSRQIGCVLVRDRRILAAGYNGSPSGISLCQNKEKACFRREEMGFKSGEGLEFCPAVHAEANTVVNAAKHGVKVEGAWLYTTAGVPCKNCIGVLINAGVERIVIGVSTIYDSLSVAMASEAGIEIVGFEDGGIHA